MNLPPEFVDIGISLLGGIVSGVFLMAMRRRSRRPKPLKHNEFVPSHRQPREKPAHLKRPKPPHPPTR